MIYTKTCVIGCDVQSTTVVDTWKRVDSMVSVANGVVVSPKNGSILVRSAEDPYDVIRVYPNDGIQFSKIETVMYEIKGMLPYVECSVTLS